MCDCRVFVELCYHKQYIPSIRDLSSEIGRLPSNFRSSLAIDNIHSPFQTHPMTQVSQLVSWCFEPSQPQRNTTGLMTQADCRVTVEVLSLQTIHTLDFRHTRWHRSIVGYLYRFCYHRQYTPSISDTPSDTGRLPENCRSSLAPQPPPQKKKKNHHPPFQTHPVTQVDGRLIVEVLLPLTVYTPHFRHTR